jgi:hypothetical protein
VTTPIPVPKHGIDLAGLTAAPAQAWGAVRIVPLIRDEPITGLRLHARLHGPDDLSIVHTGPRTAYIAYIPHAFVATWTDDATPAAAYGTQLVDPDAHIAPACIDLRFRRRMARREDKQRLRFLPLHLALEGYLMLQFGGPPIAWQEWTHRAVAYGLSPRSEGAYSGTHVPGLDDALRIFEIHPGQCGAALYIADALAAAFVVPHPDDYRALHPTLLRDLYGEQLYQYAHLFPSVPDYRARLDETRIDTVADLRAALAEARREWTAFHDVMAGGLLGPQNLTFSQVYRMGRFGLSRFLPPFDPDGENHIGETITDADGRLAYLKTFRLSAAQVRRGFLLSRLADHDWNLDATAAHLGTDRQGLAQRLNSAGFGHLLRPEVIDACRKGARREKETGSRCR